VEAEELLKRRRARSSVISTTTSSSRSTRIPVACVALHVYREENQGERWPACT